MIPTIAPVFAEAPPVNVRENDFLIHGPSPELPIGRTDEYGDVWLWHDIEGWFDSPPFSSPVQQLGNSDYASWAERFPREARELKITGTCFANGKYRAHLARERLFTYWGDPNRVFNLVVDEPTVSKMMEVRLNGPILAPWRDSVGRARGFKFEIPLVAKDPLKYSVDMISDQTSPVTGGQNAGLTMPITMPVVFAQTVAPTSGGVARLVNLGNEASAPISRITGGDLDAGWKIVNEDDGGKTLWVDQALKATDELILNHKTGDATLNGSSVDVRLYGTWFNLVPGQNRIKLITQTNTNAILTVSGRHAWR
jgi:hypothetical protein